MKVVPIEGGCGPLNDALSAGSPMVTVNRKHSLEAQAQLDEGYLFICLEDFE